MCLQDGEIGSAYHHSMDSYDSTFSPLCQYFVTKKLSFAVLHKGTAFLFIFFSTRKLAGGAPMDRETYTIEDVAQMTGLSSRTIRTYRKMGLLGGALQGNTWTFTPEQVGKLLNEPYVQGAIEAKRNAIWTGFLQDTGKQVPSLCTTADFPATDAQGANALLDRLLEQLPAGVRMNYCYDHRRNLVRIYLSGPKDLILPVLTAL